MSYKKFLIVGVCTVLVGFGLYNLFGAKIEMEGDKVSVEKHVDLIRTNEPLQPEPGYGRVYLDTDNKLYFKDDVAKKYLLSGGEGPGPRKPTGIMASVTPASGYTVPAGKALFICTASGGGQYLTIDGQIYSQNLYNSFASYYSSLVVPAGKTVYCNQSGGIRLTGYEIDAEGVAMKVTNATGYTVPAGKVLFICTARGEGQYIQIDGQTGYSPNLSGGGFYSYYSPLVVPAGKTVYCNQSGGICFTGYLKDAL